MEEDVLLRLTKNINTKDRPNDLLEIATDLQWLKDNYGNTNKIANRLGISSGMVNTFMSALKVSPKVKALIAERKIDSVFGVHALKSFSENDQLIVSQALIENTFSSQQARALVPLRNLFPDEPIGRLMNVIQQTKDNKHYVNHFPMPDKTGLQKIQNRINMLAKGEAFSLTAIDNIGVFTISKKGVKNMREDAAMKKVGFHNYLLALFNPDSSFEKGEGGMM